MIDRSDSLSAAEIAHLRHRYPRAFGHAPKDRAITLLAWTVFGLVVVACLWRLGFFAFDTIANGFAKLGDVLGFMLPPAHNGWLWEFTYGILETLGMAFLGTLLAFLAAIPLGFLGARNVIPQFLFHFGLRRIFDGLRGIDQLIWALIFVGVVGLGPFAGILAIAVSDTGTLAKLFAEAIENANRRPVDGVKAAGAGQLQEMRFGILPQVLPVMLSQALYYFESNTRSATILGVVGAGGIGLQLSDRIRANNWDEACFIIVMILITVSIIDTLSKEVRLRLIEDRAVRV